MEDTVRALVVIGVAALLLAPLTNAILDDTAASADRDLPFRDYEYDGEIPPFTPRDGEPPEGFEPPPGEGELEGEFEGPMPVCNPPDAREGPAWQTTQQTDVVDHRTESEKPFDIAETDLAIRADFEVRGLYGGIAARLVSPSGDEVVVASYEQRLGQNPEPNTALVRRDDPEFAAGEWTAVLDLSSTASYQRLEYTVTILYCATPEGAR